MAPDATTVPEIAGAALGQARRRLPKRRAHQQQCYTSRSICRQLLRSAFGRFIAVGFGIFHNAVESVGRILSCQTKMHDVLLSGVFDQRGLKPPFRLQLKQAGPKRGDERLRNPPWEKYRWYSGGPPALAACGYRSAYINHASCWSVRPGLKPRAVPTLLTSAQLRGGRALIRWRNLIFCKRRQYGHPCRQFR